MDTRPRVWPIHGKITVEGATETFTHFADLQMTD